MQTPPKPQLQIIIIIIIIIIYCDKICNQDLPVCIIIVSVVSHLANTVEILCMMIMLLQT